MYISLHVKHPPVLSDFNKTWFFSTYFPENLKYYISWKSFHGEPSCSMRPDRQTHVTKLILAFRNFAKKRQKDNYFISLSLYSAPQRHLFAQDWRKRNSSAYWNVSAIQLRTMWQMAQWVQRSACPRWVAALRIHAQNITGKNWRYTMFRVRPPTKCSLLFEQCVLKKKSGTMLSDEIHFIFRPWIRVTAFVLMCLIYAYLYLLCFVLFVLCIFVLFFLCTCFLTCFDCTAIEWQLNFS
jgi:hypothetical protein